MNDDWSVTGDQRSCQQHVHLFKYSTLTASEARFFSRQEIILHEMHSLICGVILRPVLYSTFFAISIDPVMHINESNLCDCMK